jgi:hypothetical protein
MHRRMRRAARYGDGLGERAGNSRPNNEDLLLGTPAGNRDQGIGLVRAEGSNAGHMIVFARTKMEWVEVGL